jgi:alkanesulfonate monooxygenase SsuD/methylene tetrahydromethanopterin reductase-like flavin-dependent oxidoreductase (luciferase family)
MTAQQDPTSQPAFFGDNALKLGVFCLNVSGGMMLSGASKPQLDWDENVSVAKVADETGWEFLLPIGRWRGQGGKYNANAEQYECFSWAAAISALTSRIQVFATCHVPIFHPMLAAKMSATIDNISRGRFGLNIVSGWNAAEFGMFGIEQLAHDDRYAATAEWLDIMESLWANHGELDHHGKYYQISRGYLEPKPVQQPRPLVISAGMSRAGLDFALTRADYCFVGSDNWDLLEDTVRRSRARAAELNRELNALTFCSLVVKDTEAEAKRYFEWYVDKCGDFDAAQRLVNSIIAGGAQSLPPEIVARQARAFIAGWGALPLVGTAEQVADQLARISKLGIAGVSIGWLDYAEGIGRFNAEVMPLLCQAGLRVSREPAVLTQSPG